MTSKIGNDAETRTKNHGLKPIKIRCGQGKYHDGHECKSRANPIIRLHPPNIFMPHISELYDHYILGKKLVIWEVMTNFFGLHLIALQCGGQKFGQPRGGAKLAKSSPPISKSGQFGRIIPPNAQHRFAPLTTACHRCEVFFELW